MTELETFDWKFYLDRYEDLRKAGINTRYKAFRHWNNFGRKEGRISKISDGFDWIRYINNYEDLRKAGITTREKAFSHWITYGQKEGRNYFHLNYCPLPHEIGAYVESNKLQDRVFYTGKISREIYNELICGCDVGLQIRAQNASGNSGSVMDCLSLDVPIITVLDVVQALDIDHEMLIGFDLLKYNDWVPLKTQYGGYSNNLTIDISDTLIKYQQNKGINDNKISDIVNGRFDNYAKEIMKVLSLAYNSKIAIVTPYPPEFTGVADFSFATIQELSKYIKKIDIYTDSKIKLNNINKMDDIRWKRKNYDRVVYVVGNSGYHLKIINYLKEFGGICILHDDNLVSLYESIGKLPKHIVVDYDKGHSMPYFDNIINADKIIVHSKKLTNVIKNIYNKNVDYIPFCPYNKLYRYNAEEKILIKKKYGIDGDVNIVINGRIKCPYQALKISEYLRAKNIICKIFFVGP
ncbi:MAG: glycosyltransferase [Hyperionvirus sp.]|uniref:Glycosyltransferase n=1 Tax=Hyperionvirus sp. TaxID=2487770 RepID=A0A3G5AAF2_9VIRU|nr:MAG: glycosyltransferase [Hyperionvirus sp.]